MKVIIERTTPIAFVPITITIVLETEEDTLGFAHLITCFGKPVCNYKSKGIAIAELIHDIIRTSDIQLPNAKHL